MSYVEFESDHNFTAWLSTLTPSKVLKDRTAVFSKPERQRERFFTARTRVEREEARRQEVAVALLMAAEMKTQPEGEKQ